jgi:nucleotide-binding universal stress UspA family protein
MQRIVVGVDGSAASRAALSRAADLARDLGAGLEVVQAWQYPPDLHDWDAVPSNYGFLPMVPPVQRVEEGVRDDLAATVADWAPAGGGRPEVSSAEAGTTAS